MTIRRFTSVALAFALVFIPASAVAQEGEGMDVEVVAAAPCDEATFEASVTGGSSPYNLFWEFGDGESEMELGVEVFPSFASHIYPEPGEYSWQLSVQDTQGGIADTSGSIPIDGVSVELISDPFPPLVVLENGEATVDFTAVVTGDEGVYSYSWDLNGDGGSDSESSEGASYTYIEAGKYQASLVVTLVTEDCEFVGVDTLPVVVIDPDEEACHPMAQRIADAVNTLFPLQAEDLYTCENIFDMFRGGLTGSQLGFGRLWHAYKLAETIQDLTWEEIRDWHLDGNGWGGLVQLNRFADLLELHGIRDLVDLVVSGEASISEVRHSVRSVLRYDADFEDALARLADGTSPGELGRFYRTVQDLQLTPEELDAYMAAGSSLQELAHAARLGERSGSDWTQIAEAHAAGNSWGAIGQAQRLAEDGDWMSVLEVGIRETREQTREADQVDRDQERLDRTADQLAARYGIGAQQVLDLYHNDCAQEWNCVRKALREQPQSSAGSDQGQTTAVRLARQYGVSEEDIMSLFDGSCAGSWSCVRAELRGESDRGGGPKPKD
jgi:hypothetical protein